MNLLKPLFFNKYKPRTTYQYNDDWKDVSLDRKTGRFSIKTRKTTHDPKGVVILAHPMKEMGKFYFIEYGHADLYVDLGYHVVVFDFNGFGESQDTKNFEFKYDVIDVIRVTRKLYPSFNPFLHGVSFGASQIILGCLSNETLVSGLIVESSVSSNIDYYKGRGSNLFYILNAYNAFFLGKMRITSTQIWLRALSILL